jgi:hypothetical protein
MRRHRFGRIGVFGDDLIRVQRCRARSAIGDHEIDAERHWQACARQSFGDRHNAIIRQAVMHDDAVIVGQPPQPRLRIALGGIDRDRTDLNRAKAETGEIAEPLLSKPAASPIGDGKRRPATLTASRSSSMRVVARIACAAQPRRAPAAIAR